MSNSQAPSAHALPILGKHAIVTGSSRGIGAAIALELARQGASVAIVYTSESSKSKAEALKAEIEALPHKPSAFVVRADMTSADGPKSIVSQLREQVGDDLRVDILVNNAGGGIFGSLADIKIEDYDYTYNLNVRGPMLLTQAVLPHLSPAARIVNMSSVGSHAGFHTTTLYASAKAALEAATRVWARELGHNGTTVNSVLPGPVDTDLMKEVPTAILEQQKATTPVQNRVGTSQEIASIVAWLCSPAAAWVSGQNICASGGWMML